MGGILPTGTLPHLTHFTMKTFSRRNRATGHLSYEVLEPRQLLAGMPIITEFVASNSDGIVDGNGDTSDWIEIHNAGDATVDLLGYSLTDDADTPAKWTFESSTALDPGAYLVVFASGDGTPDPAGNLHTNFALSAGGEYLALSDSGGTVLSEFGSSTTNYPALQSDEAYGLAFNSTTSDVVTPTSNARYIIPGNNAVDSTWTANNFNDSAWQTGSASLGYETTPADYDDLIITQVPVGTTSLYARMSFNVTDSNTLLDTLQMKYDDGFIAYLNGKRIASANAPAVGAFNSAATGQHNDSDAVEYVDFDISAFSDDLLVGNNTLAIHMLNRNSGSSDFLSVPNLKTSTGSLITPITEGRLLAATPRLANTNLQATDVEFSRVGGTFTGSFQLALASTGANETIRYTTNGSLPTESSPVYNSPITVNSTTQFRARAFGPIGQLGTVAVETYSLTETSTSNFTSDLPIIVIENLGQGIPGADFEDATLSLYEIDSATGRSSLSNVADVTSLIGQHRRGSSTFNNAKPNLRIETRDADGEDKNVSLLGLPSESDFILAAPYRFDRAMIRDSFLFNLSNQMGQYAVRTRFVEVYANTNDGTLNNDDYLGVYVLTENIKRDDDRVDIPKLDPGDNTAPEITGGYIIKIDRTDGQAGSNWETSRGVPNRGGASFVHVEPERVDMSTEQVNYIRGYVQDLEDALYGPNATDPELGYAAFLDVEASIDHHILRTLSLEPDSLGLSTFLTKDRDGKLKFGPLWDSDRSMGSDNDLRSSDPEAWFSGVDFFEFDWWGQLFNDPDFKQQWVDRWQELRQTTYSDANVLATLNGLSSQLEEAQARNFARWPEVAPNGGEFAEAGLTGWEAEVSHLSNWLLARMAWIDGNLVDAPTLGTTPGSVSAGSQITLVSNQSGADLYYTLDGTDPRSEGGGLSSSATLYTGPLTINATAQITVRALGTAAETVGQTPGTSPWSQAEAGLFSVETPASSVNLRISELHYHPADPSSTELLDAPGTDEDDYEFVELTNVSNDAISLNGVTLGIAVDFDFTSAEITLLAPGERVLVVKNISAFEARYGTGLPIAGEYSGKFADGGERVTVNDSLGAVIHDFTYDDATPWAIRADGDGPSLEVADVNGDYADAGNWLASAAIGGTPGAANPVVLGDLNGDGFADNFDLGPLGQALFDLPAYTAAFPNIDPNVWGDFTGDGVFNNFDLAGFADALFVPAASSSVAFSTQSTSVAHIATAPALALSAEDTLGTAELVGNVQLPVATPVSPSSTASLMASKYSPEAIVVSPVQLASQQSNLQSPVTVASATATPVNLAALLFAPTGPLRSTRLSGDTAVEERSPIDERSSLNIEADQTTTTVLPTSTDEADELADRSIPKRSRSEAKSETNSTFYDQLRDEVFAVDDLLSF